ncbi:hypothetical protein [Novosphingobium sp. BL-52-GroH]|uniref:hypothetical protein n=1 Tax=Novosphingobium sp. BL-52-GroH TaxID=3349877 RepID=UPI00384D1696
MIRRPSRRLAIWLARVDAGHPRALSQLDLLQSALGGAMGSICGLAIGLIIIRPLLALVGFEGAWR